MIQFPNGGILIEPGDSMPPVPEYIDELFLDVETTSRDRNKKSINPWHDCWLLGVALTWDEHPSAYYIPVEHAYGFDGKGNIDISFMKEWLKQLFHKVKCRWINHNIKYDFHVLNNTGITIPDSIETVCTLTTAKLVDSDRQFRGGYGLDALAYQWCGVDIKHFEEALKPYLPTKGKHKNQDYGRIPVDIMAEYACTDVIVNRPVWHYIDANVPSDSRGVLATEIANTRVLCEMEAYGMRIDPIELGIHAIQLQQRLIEIYQRIYEIVGWYLNPNSNKDWYAFLCNQCGLPVLELTNENDDTKESNPSFGKDALEKYLAIHNAPKEVIKLGLEYRKKEKLKSGFITPYINQNVDGIIHATYNQAVRTGRMSCSKPNMQQLNKAAKELFKPRPGNSLFVIDYAQIEFRLIVHYIDDRDAIEAYKKNPRIDFHDWMAQLCGISRSAAKRMNFLIGYGGGKKKTCEALMQVEEIIESAQKQVQDAGVPAERINEAYTLIVQQIANHAYTTYHKKLPTLKLASRKVENMARSRMSNIHGAEMGYVINIYGRHRHLPPNRCHIGFNTICQSGAADMIKERTLELHRALKGTGIHIEAQVHDALVIEGPTPLMRDPRTINDITWIMENPKVLHKLKVPIKTNAGISEISWADADLEVKGENGIKYKPNDCTVDPVAPENGIPFSHLLGLTRRESIGYTASAVG